MAKGLIRSLVGSLAIVKLAVAAPLLEARAPAVALEEHTIPLTRNENPSGQPPTGIQRLLVALSAADDPVSSGSSPVKAVPNQISYYADVTAGVQTLQMIVDTGSSDTWFAKDGFECQNNLVSTRAPPCRFGKEYSGDFPGGKIADQHLHIAYGSGEIFVKGEMGFSNISVANLTVPKQQIGLALEGVWQGDDIAAGILGLGLPGLTDAHPGGDWSQRSTWRDSSSNSILYNPLVSTIATQLSPLFGLALSREVSQSFLSFGGIPAGVKTSGDWATTPIVMKQAAGRPQKEYLYYEIAIDKMSWNGTTARKTGSDSQPPTYVVDSGTTLNLLPDAVSRAINGAFTPPALLDPESGMWFVKCDAKAPAFGIQIGGKMIWTDPSSMILPKVTTMSRNGIMCATGIGSTNGWPYILGDTFMQGLVAITDVQKMELRFAKRA